MVRLWLCSILFLGFSILSFGQNDSIELLNLTFRTKQVRNYLIPLDYASGMNRYFGDGTHLIILGDGYMMNYDSLEVENRVICIANKEEYNFHSSRVHFKIHSIVVNDKKAQINLSAILTNGVIIKREDLDKRDELYSSWLKEQLHNMSLEVSFRKKRGVWILTRTKTVYVNMYKKW
ncbi:MAG: hypothetical protein ACJA0U_003408 [Salibacteraceae bacterium]|jgi:hypothetical protein